MLRYPLPYIGLGLTHMSSKIYIHGVRFFESYFKEIYLREALKNTPPSLARYPEVR
jgi:hypothetical protein